MRWVARFQCYGLERNRALRGIQGGGGRGPRHVEDIDYIRLPGVDMSR